MEKATTDLTMLKVDEISRAFDCDPDHNAQVTNLALSLFDSLTPLHHYNGEERRLLEIAGRMHDIGWSGTVLKKHHKLSGKMILKSDIPGLKYNDKMTVALIARYHTKSLPDAMKHPKFASLSLKKRKIIEWLAAILRVADALDSSHNGAVKKVKTKIGKKQLTIILETNGDFWDQIRRVRRKHDLLVKKTRKAIVYQC